MANGVVRMKKAPPPNGTCVFHAAKGFTESLILAAVFLALIAGLFVVLRTFVLWYWKLDKIERHLAQLVTHFTGKPPL